MAAVNVATCELTERHERGRFRCAAEPLGESLGARLLGAAVYEMGAGDTNWPYHYHHGVEEWMLVVSGAPVLRDRGGERPLAPGTLVSFVAGPAGAHTVAGPGRVVIFSAGDSGWGEAFVSIYPDSGKLGAAPGVMFRRADALEAWGPTATDRSGAAPAPTADACPAVDLMAVDPAALDSTPPPTGGSDDKRRGIGASLGVLLGARDWAPTVWELAPGLSIGPYHYEWCREEWAIVLAGSPRLRHPEGEEPLERWDVVCFPEGPGGARRLSNDGPGRARVLVISTPVGRPMSAFQPDQGTVVVRLSDDEGFRFRESDRIADYWDGESGAAPGQR